MTPDFEAFIPDDVDVNDGIEEVGDSDDISEETVRIPEWIPESERRPDDAALIAAIERGRKNAGRHINFEREY